MAMPLPVDQAAEALEVPRGTLRRYLREGCPVVSKGRRGRGHAVLVDPDAVREWLGAGERERAFLEMAAAVPDVLAEAANESLRQASGVDKRRLAGILAANWYIGATAILERMRKQCPSVPDVTSIPEEIEALRKIARND